MVVLYYWGFLAVSKRCLNQRSSVIDKLHTQEAQKMIEHTSTEIEMMSIGDWYFAVTT